jgi:DNA-binding transcriptional ArsR family regulator
LVKALAHPVRRRVLRALHDAGEARSPRELSDGLGVHLSTVSYHVRILRDVHALALTDSIPVRSFYVSVLDGDGWPLSVLDSSRRQDGEG